MPEKKLFGRIRSRPGLPPVRASSMPSPTTGWRGEYVYTDYGSVTLYNRDRNRADFRNEMHLLRVGASYRF